MAGEKTCVICGEDCSGRPRLKDSKGQYACQACVEAKRRPRSQAEAKAKTRPKAEAPAAAVAVDDALAGDGGGFSMDQFLGGQAGEADASSYCPGCGAAKPAGAVVCMGCGFDSSSGKAMSTKVRKAKVRKARRGPRLSGGAVFMLVAAAMLVLLPVAAMASPEAAMLALLVAGLWNTVAYFMMVFAAFQDEDKFWGWIGLMFFVPLANTFCVLAFVLFYCTIGGQRGTFKVNYWASFLAGLIVLAILASTDPELFSGVAPADPP